MLISNYVRSVHEIKLVSVAIFLEDMSIMFGYSNLRNKIIP